MLKAQKNTLIITERDEKLFRYLFINKVASIRHLREDIFNQASKQAVHRRLDKLIKYGFLEVTYLRESCNKLIYSLSKKSLVKFIGDKTQMKRIQRKSSSIPHDLGVLEIKRILSNFKSVESALSENVLQSGLFDDEHIIKEIRKLNSDGIIKTKLGDDTFYFPLEYEASAKFAKRYDQLMHKYYGTDEVKAVLFISKTSGIQNKVMQAEKKFKGNLTPKFFYCLLDDLLTLKTKTSFINHQKEVLAIN